MSSGIGLRAGAAVLAAAIALAVGAAAADASVGDFAMAVQPDGKILVAGGSGRVGGAASGREFGAVARYDTDGRLDRHFGGGDGIVFARSLQPFTALALQPDGRILVTSPLGGEAGLARLLPDGRLDKGFGEGGVLYAGASTAWYPTSVAVAKDGGIFTGGMTGYLADPGEHWYGWLYRITPDGRSGDRWAGMTSGAGDQPKTFVNDFVFAPGGSVIAAGTIAERGTDARKHAVLTRLLPWSVEPGGVPTGADPSFGAGAGLVTSNFFPSSPFSEAANALAWDRGQLLLAGEAGGRLLLARYSADGTIDAGFGRRGAAVAASRPKVTGRADAVAVAHDGGILAAGASDHGCAGCSSLLLARFTNRGKLDRGFGRAGLVSPRVETDVYGEPASETAYGVATGPKGAALVGGLVTGPGSSRFFLRRYLSDGSPDRAFGDGGRVTTLPIVAGTPRPGSGRSRAGARR